MPPPPAGTSPVSPAEFVRTADRSRLLPSDRVAAAAVGARSGADAADRLVTAGLLTRFQADKLLRGFWQGLVVGPYHLLCPLGRGGMGIVYLARDSRAGGLVALKILAPQRARAELRTLARFRREMDLGRALPPHPHLTRTTDAGTANGIHFLAMEYVPGRTVRQEVADAGPLTVGAACRAFADAAAGLAAAHAAGFVHRDLKPANVVITPTGRGKVLDFGFALRVGEPVPDDPTILGGQGYTVGTMDYLPPEQAADAAAVGPPADVYALGCSLFYALTGGPPFPGGGPQEKIRAHRTAFPPPLTDQNPLLPADLDRLVQWFMAKKPGDRPAADRAAQELAAWADPVRVATPGTDPPPAEVVRAAEQRWLANRTANPAPDDDGPVAAGPASSGVELVPPDDGVELPEEIATAGSAVVRVPMGKRALVLTVAGALWLSFVCGVLVGFWLGRR